MDLRQIAADVPDYDYFLTMDELSASSHQLVADYPQVASLRVVGQTRRGDPIELITVKGGDKQAFIVGGPHPNEPIGCMTVEYLSRRLCEDDALREELGFTWHFIKSIDSDGMRLNEGWFKGPFTPTNYARHFFRPAFFDQVEWTFPFDYKDLHFHKPLPETQALMRVIDEIKPTLLFSLHNAGFGGVYYYVTEDVQPLYSTYQEIPEWYNLALDLGEPEVPFAKLYDKAVYRLIAARDMYDFYEANGINPVDAYPGGSSSMEYAEKYGTFGLVVEMPYYDDPRVNDMTPTTTLRRDAILASLDSLDDFAGWTEARLAEVKPELTLDTLFHRAVIADVSAGKERRDGQRQWAKTAEDTNRPATQAELFSSLHAMPFYSLVYLGMFARMLEAEIAAGNSSARIQQVATEARARLEEYGAKLESGLNYRVLPIRSLVGVQMCAGLATAAYLRDK
jgi:hypothetical protein